MNVGVWFAKVSSSCGEDTTGATGGVVSIVICVAPEGPAVFPAGSSTITVMSYGPPSANGVSGVIV